MNHGLYQGDFQQGNVPKLHMKSTKGMHEDARAAKHGIAESLVHPGKLHVPKTKHKPNTWLR